MPAGSKLFKETTPLVAVTFCTLGTTAPGFPTVNSRTLELVKTGVFTTLMVYT
jgi:hypothetical protein